VFELNTDTGPEVSRDRPFIPITPWLLGLRALAVELFGAIGPGPGSSVRGYGEAAPAFAAPIGTCWPGMTTGAPAGLSAEGPPVEFDQICKGRPTACTVTGNVTSRPSFSSMRSKVIPTVESGESLLWALASVTWPTIFVFLGTMIWPCASRSVAVFASILSFTLHFLASSDFDNSTESSDPEASGTAFWVCGDEAWVDGAWADAGAAVGSGPAWAIDMAAKTHVASGNESNLVIIPALRFIYPRLAIFEKVSYFVGCSGPEPSPIISDGASFILQIPDECCGWNRCKPEWILPHALLSRPVPDDKSRAWSDAW
jgi:hypothetical protein